ncbi:MAG: NAD-dependent deacylase [Bacteroidota bacterium]|nr:NAD-dependent deacylase [Bacteroidota bacterium]
MEKYYDKAAQKIKEARHCIVFTGAGISTESGVPPFRGKDGLWNKYDPEVLELSYFKNNTQNSWDVIKKIFYDYFGKAKPNPAHNILAKWEQQGLIKTIITQNIDNLHTDAGSKNVLEFHGTSGSFVCMGCGKTVPTSDIELTEKAPVCNDCGQLMKPNFIFFGERIPEPAGSLSFEEAKKADVCVIIGSTGEIIPASWVPHEAKKYGAYIIEVNIGTTAFTSQITDLYLATKASEALTEIDNRM